MLTLDGVVGPLRDKIEGVARNQDRYYQLGFELRTHRKDSPQGSEGEIRYLVTLFVLISSLEGAVCLLIDSELVFNVDNEESFQRKCQRRQPSEVSFDDPSKVDK